MKSPAIPVNEPQRLASLHESGILESGDPQRFDRLTRLAKRLFDIPVALVTLVDEEVLIFKSHDGIDITTLPRNISFCGHAILSESPLVVTDATLDERFADNPLVEGDSHLRFYAGYPLRLPDGAVAGAFCLVDREPRAFSPGDLDMLKDLAAIVEGEFAAINAATTDELTGLFNRRGFNSLASYAIRSAARRAVPLTLGWLDLDGFKKINDRYGHAEGDVALKTMANLLTSSFRDTDLTVRYSGDEFAILFSDTDENGAWIAMQHLAEEAEAFNERSGKPWKLAFSWGVTEFNQDGSTLEEWLQAADQKMYTMKNKDPKNKR